MIDTAAEWVAFLEYDKGLPVIEIVQSLFYISILLSNLLELTQ